MAHDILDAETDITLEKSNKTGQNDIHLEVMGQWKGTLLPDIYGIPVFNDPSFTGYPPG